MGVLLLFLNIQEEINFLIETVREINKTTSIFEFGMNNY